MPVAEGALIASALSAIGTTISNIALSERQKQYNEHNQDKQNLYNSPSEQIKRLQDAGISPNSLSMSNGMTVQGNTSAGLNPYSLPNVQDPMSMLSNSFLSMQQGTTENQLREVRKQEIAAQIENLKANAEKLGVDTQYQSILNTFAAAREMSALQTESSQRRLTVWQTKLVKQQARQLAYTIDNILPEEVKKLVGENNLTVAQLDLLLAQIANTEASTEQTEAQTELIEAQTEGQTQENARYNEITNSVLQQYQATINKLTQEANLTEQEAFYYLYELARRYGIKLFGIPVPGQGGYREVSINERIQKDAIGKYGASSIRTDR